MDYQPIPQMIQNGQFGVNAPIQQTGYNPYMNQPQFNPYPYNNMVPINAVYQQPQQNNFVFQPVNNTYNYYQEPRYNYYDPYGSRPQNPYGYQNQYADYQNYGGYSPFTNAIQQQKAFAQQIELQKMKYRMAAAYRGETLDEEELDKIVNPRNEANIPSAEEVADRQHYQFMQYLSSLVNNPVQYETSYDREARYCREYSESMHKELDNHSMAEFFNNDLWRLEREEWIRKNVAKRNGRNLSKTYNSNAYNELLKMHRDSNPYTNQLMNNSLYDNNIDDLELGMSIVFDKERRRKAVFEGKVPTIVSSEETQKRREAWTNQIINQIYNKKGVVPNV